MSSHSQCKSKKSPGLSFIELMIVLLLLTSAALTIILVIKPKKYIDRARDNKLVADLDKLKKALEEFYSDNNCYPTPEQICYTSSFSCSGGTCCYICGKEQTSPSLEPYIKPLPCHPRHDSEKILYKTEAGNCPGWFKIFTPFLDITNPLNASCARGGCGPDSTYGYDYAVTSPNTSLEKGTEITRAYYCFSPLGLCSNCGQSYQECLSSSSCRGIIYGNKNCK